MSAEAGKPADLKSDGRPLRVDAQRSLDALLVAAKEVFASSGVDAPVRDIAERAGVGIATLYRRFPQRADLIAAVFRHELDECADVAGFLATEHPPFQALVLWAQRFALFVGTKRGLAQALYSGDPAYASLPEYFEERLRPAFLRLFDEAVAAGAIRPDLDPDEVLHALGSLCGSNDGKDSERARRLVALLMDGLRYGAEPLAPLRLDEAEREG